MKKIIIATQNKGKIVEIKELLKEHLFEVMTMKEAGLDIDIVESGKTFEENAYIKAKSIYDLTKEMVLADDSGLEVEYLNGAPGLYTSRFAGENATDMDKINKLLDHLRGVPIEKRNARFVCSICIFFKNGNYKIVTETCEGTISEKPVGDNGFGYDPIFYLNEFGATSAQITSEQKHTVSHRGKALKKAINIILDANLIA